MRSMSRPRNSRARAARSASSTAGAVAKQDRSARRTNTTDLAPHDLRLLVQEQVRTEIKSWSGPLPPPEALEHFNRVVPGCAEKIVDAFVQQSAHRRSLESMVVSGSEARANRGQWLIYSLLLLVVVGGIVVALRSTGLGGAAIITAGLGGGVALYVLGGRASADH